MAQKDDCIFCKIVDGDIPAMKVYEDDHCLAFLDISQATKGHTLLIPKNHEENIYELQEETAAHLLSKAPAIARAMKSTLQCEGMNLVNNNGEKASQSVFHFHMHLIPRYGNDEIYANWNENPKIDMSDEDMHALAERVQQAVQF
ncbi:HIT family protein [Geomicrobium sp. JSM 1781026]|uniref:HIT family protein n=1 Tax=Geomicrobium sp. JSM 1781026 TaxID=3344580 RepID=UPI0035C14D65